MPPKAGNTQLSIMLDPELRAALAAQAGREQRSLGAMARVALRRGLGLDPPQLPPQLSDVVERSTR